MSRQLRGLSGQTWQKIVQLLGTGDFVRIEFRPPRNGDEEVICKIAKDRNGGKGTWWICEADYLDCVSLDAGEIIGCDSVTRRFPFRLYDDPVE